MSICHHTHSPQHQYGFLKDSWMENCGKQFKIKFSIFFYRDILILHPCIANLFIPSPPCVGSCISLSNTSTYINTGPFINSFPLATAKHLQFNKSSRASNYTYIKHGDFLQWQS